ncbi:hypothetical protein WJX72_003518 [[Myrmecia] bisecta]|uniref:Uncharacterized protein n=1 Tax=[Myrmecia] bisecta TaxID=41462 RepID=A0AAW1QF83_9CHLO
MPDPDSCSPRRGDDSPGGSLSFEGQEGSAEASTPVSMGKPPGQGTPLSASSIHTHESFAANPMSRQGNHAALAHNEQHAHRWQAAQNDVGQFVPHGMDQASFVAGERTALMRAFRETLPSQQALGQLFSAVQQLDGRLQQKEQQSRCLETSAAQLAASAEMLSQRMEAIENLRIPALEERIADACSSSPSQDFQATLQLLQTTVSRLADPSHQGYQPPTLASAVFHHFRWLLSTLGGYTQKALAKSDVAAMIFARKILLEPAAPEVMRGEQMVRADAPPSSSGYCWNPRTGLGALLFLAAVEASWHAHERSLRYLPKRFHPAATPSQLGLRVARLTVWSAAFVLVMVQARHACYAAADRSITGLGALFGQLNRLTSTLPGDPIVPSMEAASAPVLPDDQDLIPDVEMQPVPDASFSEDAGIKPLAGDGQSGQGGQSMAAAAVLPAVFESIEAAGASME